MHLPLSVFAYHSSDVNWCEPDYEVSSFTVEFWNSISGIPMIVLSLIMISLNGDYTRLVPHCRYANVVWWLLVVTGIGSIYFHATLSLFGQFLDEISIIWLGFAVLAMYAEPSVVCLPSSFNKNRTLYQSLMLAAAIVATTLSFIEPKFNHVWLFLFVVPVVRGVTMKKARNPNMEKFQALGRNGLVFLALAVICWVIDRIFCPFMLSIRFPYLHAVWHILVLIAANMVFVFGAFDYANQTASRHEPYLAFVPLLGSYVGIWYVAFRLPKPEKHMIESTKSKTTFVPKSISVNKF